jgi:hypothetical protein
MFLEPNEYKKDVYSEDKEGNRAIFKSLENTLILLTSRVLSMGDLIIIVLMYIHCITHIKRIKISNEQLRMR